MSVVAVSGRKETAFVIEQVGPASTHADRRHVDDVLVRTRPVVYPEIQQVLRPGLFSETVPATADLDIFAWRELAWRNAELPQAAPTPQAREVVADEIQQHAQD
jgi:hypothetical protein